MKNINIYNIKLPMVETKGGMFSMSPETAQFGHAVTGGFYDGWIEWRNINMNMNSPAFVVVKKGKIVSKNKARYGAKQRKKSELSTSCLIG